jgi:hypothetical protein
VIVKEVGIACLERIVVDGHGEVMMCPEGTGLRVYIFGTRRKKARQGPVDE